MKLKKRGKEWWIIDGTEEYGPYTDKVEATSDMQGIERFYKNIDNRRFFTTEKLDKPKKRGIVVV